MELLNGLFVYSFTAFLLAFLVAKLISLVVSSGDVGAGKESSSVGVGEGGLEKRLKVESLKSLKEEAKKVSAETVLVSEFKGETEPSVVKADDSFDDRKELGSAERNLEIPGTEDSEACSADQLLSAGEAGGLESYVVQRLEDCFGVGGPAENEGLVLPRSDVKLEERDVECKEVGCPIEGFDQEIDSGNDLDKWAVYEHSTYYKEGDGIGEETDCKEVGCSIEGFEQGNSSGNDLEKLAVYDRSTDYKENDVVGEETEVCDSYHKEEAGSHGDQELVSGVIPCERREVSEQDEGKETSEPKSDNGIDAGLLDDEDVVDGQHEHHTVLETESEVHTQEPYVDKVDGQSEELRSLVSTMEDVVNRDEEGRIDDERTKRRESKVDDVIDLGFYGGENVVDDQHKHRVIVESSEETEPNDGTQGGFVSQVDYRNEETRDEEVRLGDKGKGEMEISDGEEWEGIERNELEREFAKALNFVECGGKEGQLSTLGSDVIMQLYGLQKVSMEGPCHEPPPMALKLSARAKWNAWQKLGSMIPEEAMEKYINLLADKVPGWIGDPCVEDKLSSEADGARACSSSDANLGTTLTPPLTCTDESKLGEEPVMRAGDFTGNPMASNKDEE